MDLLHILSAGFGSAGSILLMCKCLLPHRWYPSTALSTRLGLYSEVYECPPFVDSEVPLKSVEQWLESCKRRRAGSLFESLQQTQ